MTHGSVFAYQHALAYTIRTGVVHLTAKVWRQPPCRNVAVWPSPVGWIVTLGRNVVAGRFGHFQVDVLTLQLRDQATDERANAIRSDSGAS